MSAHVSRKELDAIIGEATLLEAVDLLDGCTLRFERNAVEKREMAREILRLRTELGKAERILSTPELHNFAAGCWTEAAHQRARWASEHDAGKAPADWFWLVGYLAGKALAAHLSGNTEKALHHTISTAAALANWHSAILGKTNMRPGIAEPTGTDAETTKDPKC